ncbi:MAG: hypothetical protein IPK68_18440 [Bdellovibrionales bacterium]|nr:hypothetical protein [Bdellovibrionales bacterium]
MSADQRRILLGSLLAFVLGGSFLLFQNCGGSFESKYPFHVSSGGEPGGIPREAS